MSSRRWRAHVAERRGLDESAPTVEGHPLGAIARRLENPSICACCGTPGLIWRVSVEARADGRRSTIDLCGRCLQRENPTWAIRWRVVPFGR